MNENAISIPVIGSEWRLGDESYIITNINLCSSLGKVEITTKHATLSTTTFPVHEWPVLKAILFDQCLKFELYSDELTKGTAFVKHVITESLQYNVADAISETRDAIDEKLYTAIDINEIMANCHEYSTFEYDESAQNFINLRNLQHSSLSLKHQYLALNRLLELIKNNQLQHNN